MKKLLVYLTTLGTILSLSGCGKNWEIADDATKITVAASITPHAEILKECKGLMTEKGYELDIYIPSKKIAIEYDGSFWHENKTKKDLEKNQKCKKDGIILYRIR